MKTSYIIIIVLALVALYFYNKKQQVIAVPIANPFTLAQQAVQYIPVSKG